MYSYEVEKLILSKIPPSIVEVMTKEGWNVFGIYEVVKESLKQDKINGKKSKER